MRYVKRKPEFVKKFVEYITNFLVELAKQEREERAEVLSIDSMTSVKACLEIVPKYVVILGNISPIDLQLESKEYIYKKCIDLLEEVEGYDNFILSTGCNVIDGTPKENVAQLYKAVEDFGSFS